MASSIKWWPWGKYAIVSVPYPKNDVDRVIKLKGYSISKVYDGTVATYIAWELPSTWLGKFNTVDEAKGFIEKIKDSS